MLSRNYETCNAFFDNWHIYMTETYILKGISKFCKTSCKYLVDLFSPQFKSSNFNLLYNACIRSLQ